MDEGPSFGFEPSVAPKGSTKTYETFADLKRAFHQTTTPRRLFAYRTDENGKRQWYEGRRVL